MFWTPANDNKKWAFKYLYKISRMIRYPRDPCSNCTDLKISLKDRFVFYQQFAGNLIVF